MSTNAEKFPHPGDGPPRPAEDAGYSKEEIEAGAKYNAWMKAVRRHVVATSVDAIAAIVAEGGEVSHEQRIAAVLGAAYLEDSLSSHNPFAAMFGGAL